MFLVLSHLYLISFLTPSSCTSGNARPIKFLLIIFQKTEVRTYTATKPKLQMNKSVNYSFSKFLKQQGSLPLALLGNSSHNPLPYITCPLDGEGKSCLPHAVDLTLPRQVIELTPRP